ncbi:hypothetical protein ABK040_015031 [Willaertia magna]
MNDLIEQQCKEQQEQELEVLQSIFLDDFQLKDNSSFTLSFPSELNNDDIHSYHLYQTGLYLHVTLPSDYPLKSLPIFSIEPTKPPKLYIPSNLNEFHSEFEKKREFANEIQKKEVEGLTEYLKKKANEIFSISAEVLVFGLTQDIKDFLSRSFEEVGDSTEEELNLILEGKKSSLITNALASLLGEEQLEQMKEKVEEKEEEGLTKGEGIAFEQGYSSPYISPMKTFSNKDIPPAYELISNFLALAINNEKNEKNSKKKGLMIGVDKYLVHNRFVKSLPTSSTTSLKQSSSSSANNNNMKGVKRVLHKAAFVNTKMTTYIFGGYQNNMKKKKMEMSNDLLSFRIIKDNLSQQQHINENQIEITKVKIFDNSPIPNGRILHTFTYDRKNQSILLIGGLTEDGAIRNDIYSFNYSIFSWKRHVDEPCFPSICNHSCIIHNDYAFVFGGWLKDLNGYCNDLITIELRNNMRSSRKKLSQISPRGGSVLCYHKDTSLTYAQKDDSGFYNNEFLIIFGGSNEKDVFNDLYFYNLHTGDTIKQVTFGLCPTISYPSIMNTNAGSDITNSIVLYGGYLGKDEGWSNLVYELDVASKAWKVNYLENFEEFDKYNPFSCYFPIYDYGVVTGGSSSINVSFATPGSIKNSFNNKQLLESPSGSSGKNQQTKNQSVRFIKEIKSDSPESMISAFYLNWLNRETEEDADLTFLFHHTTNSLEPKQIHCHKIMLERIPSLKRIIASAEIKTSTLSGGMEFLLNEKKYLDSYSLRYYEKTTIPINAIEGLEFVSYEVFKCILQYVYSGCISFDPEFSSKIKYSSDLPEIKTFIKDLYQFAYKLEITTLLQALTGTMNINTFIEQSFIPNLTKVQLPKILEIHEFIGDINNIYNEEEMEFKEYEDYDEENENEYNQKEGEEVNTVKSDVPPGMVKIIAPESTHHEEESMKYYYILAHKTLLSLRSSYFKSLFDLDFAESKHRVVLMDQVSIKGLHAILYYLYSDQLIPQLNPENAIEVYLTANQLALKDLQEKIRIFIRDTLSDNDLHITCQIVKLSEMVGDKVLGEYCLYHLAREYNKLHHNVDLMNELSIEARSEISKKHIAMTIKR